MEVGLGSGTALPTRRRGRSGRGLPSPVYGCHVVAVGGGEVGRTRARGRGGAGPRVRTGRKGGESAQQHLPPFLFFFEFLFSKSFLGINGLI